MNIESLASYLSRTAISQAKQQVSKQGKHCDTCKLIRGQRAFVRGHKTCRSCERRAERLVPSCHPMLLAKW